MIYLAQQLRNKIDKHNEFYDKKFARLQSDYSALRHKRLATHSLLITKLVQQMITESMVEVFEN